MRNSILITSDLKSLILVDTTQEDQRLAIGKRGVLLNVLGNDVCATEVPAEMDTHVSNLLKSTRPFFEFEMVDAAKSQLCITYNDANNTVFIIGITDVIIGFSAPVELPKDKVTTFAVRLKESTTAGLSSKAVIIARLETSGVGVASKRFVRFYHLANS